MHSDIFVISEDCNYRISDKEIEEDSTFRNYGDYVGHKVFDTDKPFSEFAKLLCEYSEHIQIDQTNHSFILESGYQTETFQKILGQVSSYIDNIDQTAFATDSTQADYFERYVWEGKPILVWFDGRIMKLASAIRLIEPMREYFLTQIFDYHL